MAVYFPIERLLNRPIRSLIGIFVIWRALMVTVAFLTPGEGYDTSTSLFLGRMNDAPSSIITQALRRLAQRLSRWDAIYFVQAATHDYTYEQEWAFSWGMSRLVPRISHFTGLSPSLHSHALIIIAISHFAHLLSVLVLYDLVLNMAQQVGYVKQAFIAACLHIVTPAGMFLSSPYGESMFSLLNFAGMLCYCISLKGQYLRRRPSPTSDMWLIYAGSLFGLSIFFRSNGLFSGLLFLHDLIATSYSGLTEGITVAHLRRAAIAVIAGLVTGTGALIPQWLAFNEYCTSKGTGEPRPWCRRIPPSIYTWVQGHYWNVGFMHYWTLSNAPLFILAAPMLYLLLRTGLEPFIHRRQTAQKPEKTSGQNSLDEFRGQCLQRLALPQILIALLALTSFHVQVINRISSGYPLWYIVLSRWIIEQQSPENAQQTRIPALSRYVVQAMIVYGLVQGVLFGSFLPPA